MGIDDKILQLPIGNIASVTDNIIRGETLWTTRNRRHIPAVKEAGVEMIVDFRTADFTEGFSEVCRREGLEYRHYPIDKANQSDEELWCVLPEMFELFDNRKCYISFGDYTLAFEMAGKYRAKFIQIDSVCGHLAKKG